MTIPEGLNDEDANNDHPEPVAPQTGEQRTSRSAELIDLIDYTVAPDLPIPNIRQDINRQLNINQPTPSEEPSVVNFPAVDPHPINEFTTPGYISCAFPWLFPTGMYIYYLIDIYIYFVFSYF